MLGLLDKGKSKHTTSSDIKNNSKGDYENADYFYPSWLTIHLSCIYNS